MRFLSTGGRAPAVSLGVALRQGLAPDGGLYLPETLPPLPESFFNTLPGTPLVATATAVLRQLLGEEIPASELAALVAEALDFEIPLVPLTERIWVLELFHGPTLAFKDVGARFLARLLARTPPDGDERGGELTVLVATSGDTGGAVAQAFWGVAGTRVVILYPHGQVSPLQERQFTTLGGNVVALAVAGTFDDCQRLVKQAFADPGLQRAVRLTSANSINVGRLLPQAVYYFHAAAQLGAHTARPRIFATPSGNFGNLAAGLIAKRLGLAVRRFVAATNVNDVVPHYLATGRFEPRPSLRTLSNAMDVGDPSNFARILHLYAGDHAAIAHDLIGSAHDDAATRRAIRQVDAELGYLLDPHTAVGYLALEEVLRHEPEETIGIVLATAHPAKFRDEVEAILGRTIPLPAALAARLGAPVVSEPLANHFEVLRRRLQQLA